MTSENEVQIQEWNGAMGERWAAIQEEMDRTIAPFGEAALRAAAAVTGERVIDVGCGCGTTSMALAEQVGAGGKVLGVDVSAPMLAVARERAVKAGLDQLSFEEADASRAELPQDVDLLFSRFGVMFFDDPPAALAHLRSCLKPGGRIAFAVWRSFAENEWASLPIGVARKAVGIEGGQSDPHAPGPFAFGDADRVRGILGEAGYSDIAFTAFDAPFFLGSTPRKAAEGASKSGPLARFAREAGEAHLPKIVDAVEAAFKPLANEKGLVFATGSIWIITARA